MAKNKALEYKVTYKHGTYHFRLRKLCKDKNLAYSSVKHQAYISDRTFDNYATGEVRKIDLDILDKLAGILECNTKDIIEYIPKN